jgi:phosphinothricin acetyltransferase
MIGRMPATGFKFGRWLDTVIMQKPLGPGATAPVDTQTYPGTIRPKA